MQAVKKILSNQLTLLLAALVLFAAGFLLDNPDRNDHSSAIASFERTLHKKEQRLVSEVDSLLPMLENHGAEELYSAKTSYYQDLFDRNGLALFAYEEDTLQFQSDNTIPVDNYLRKETFRTGLLHLRNGWYESFAAAPKGRPDVKVMGLVLLKHEFPYQNEYLVNDFQDDFDLSEEVRITLAGSESSNAVHTLNGTVLCALIFPAGSSSENGILLLAVLVNLLGLLFAVLFLRKECRLIGRTIGRNYATLLFILTLAALRFLMIKTSFPRCFYELPLFSPNYYGDASSFWLGSLGDLVIDALLIVYGAYYFHRECRFRKKHFQRLKLSPFITVALSAAGLFFVSRIANRLFISIISNSSVSFNLNDLFSLSPYSYLALAVMGMLLFAFFFLADRAVISFGNSGLSKKRIILAVGAGGLVYAVYSHLFGPLDLALMLWPVALVLLMILMSKEAGGNYSFSASIIMVLLLSLLSSHVLIKYSDKRENDSRKLFAQKLADEQDPVAELLFTDIGSRIPADSALKRSLFSSYFSKEDFRRNLIQKYFSGYWEKYDIRISAFDKNCYPLMNEAGSERDNLAYFENIVEHEGVPTADKNLFVVNNPEGKISYLAHFKMGDTLTERSAGDMFLELDSKSVSEEEGFPELLLDREMGMDVTLSNYSYARYKNGELANYHGRYPYSLSDASLPKFPEKFGLFEQGGYNHLLYNEEDNTLVVISKADPGWLGRTTVFSYLFAFFSLLLLGFLFLRQFSKGFSFVYFSFKNRIQYLLVMIVLISLALFGGGTIFYIKKQYQEKNKESVRDKMISALVETTQELGSEEKLKMTQSEYFTYTLKRISNIFFTDVNLYDLKGNLVGSSRLKIFDAGLMSRKMCPVSFYELDANKKLEYVHDETIGRLDYLSAYVPFKNDNGVMLGYLNMPYFAKQSELEKEINTFLVALINIYVLLFALSVTVAVFISYYVTRPLKLIQDKMSKIKLGKANEPIDWKEEDEIGSLVKEYNRMIDELHKSAELLARSERESAWREMAKQVAHEIKNPLTPMKLSVQHLQRLMDNKTPDIEEKVRKLSATLIEQIETLSAIASEFSSFAKMPKANEEKINLGDIVGNAINLFKDSVDHTEISFNSRVEGEPYVHADKEQLLRVFNNLIKNAAQAIPEDVQGRIDISIVKKADHYVVKVKDNGTGISEDAMDKIFVPSFTTKTGGMGLGLAMVKNIVETCGGKIWFETAKGKGTTFFVSLPEHKDRIPFTG